MKKAALYQRSNHVQRFDAQNVLTEFADMFRQRSNEAISVLDAGCGSGDITVDLLRPILPNNLKTLVGCDVSHEMIEFARKKYNYPNVTFELFDLSIDIEKQPLNSMGKFDYITSFYTLMWVNDQKMAINNFYKLLKPGGCILLVFLAQHPVYDFYKRQSEDIRWAQYMTDVDEFITPYQNSETPADDLKFILEDSGFENCFVEAREKCYTFNGRSLVKNVLKSISPFIDRFPADEQPVYLDDLLNYFIKENMVVISNDESEEQFHCLPSYKLMVAYAEKSSEKC